MRRLAGRLGAALAAAVLLPAAAPTASLEVSVDHLRSSKGMLRLCLTADPRNFPGCIDDARAVTRSVPAGETEIRFDGLSEGTYALAVIHDENDNGRLDSFAGIPREGFGFSRNPKMGFGPPRFGAARFQLGEGDAVQQVRMHYLL